MDSLLMHRISERLKFSIRHTSFSGALLIFSIVTMSHSTLAQKKPNWLKNVPVNKVLEWRHHIHQNPELSYEEVNTSQYVVDLLESFGNIEVKRPTKTSVVGILKGEKPGKTVAFRADMDALPIKEETGLPFSSVVDGVSHACGHDAHTAMLLGTASTLSKIRDQINGTVYFIFQHAEETPPGGSSQIIETGVLSEVDAFFGMHVLPDFPVGDVGILPDNAASTASDMFELTIFGKGSHGSMPHLGIDPVVIGAEIVTALQTIISRNVTPGELGVISIGKFHAGDVANIIPDKAELAATIRTTSAETRKLIERRIKTIIANVVQAHDAKYELKYMSNYPAIINDPDLNDFVKESVEDILGEKNVFNAPMMTASEDFAYYNTVAPTVFMTLGVGPGPANHNPAFNINESALKNGVKAQVQLILDYLDHYQD